MRDLDVNGKEINLEYDVKSLIQTEEALAIISYLTVL